MLQTSWGFATLTLDNPESSLKERLILDTPATSIENQIIDTPAIPSENIVITTPVTPEENIVITTPADISEQPIILDTPSSSQQVMNDAIIYSESNNGDNSIFDIGQNVFENQNSGRTNNSSSLETMINLLRKGKRKGHNIITQTDDDTQIIFRRDVGSHAHPIRPRFPNPVDHYNIEIQTRGSSGRWKSRASFHIIIDALGNVIDTFW